MTCVVQREDLTPGIYYAVHIRLERETIIRLTGEVPCLELEAFGFPAGRLADFTGFEPVPSRNAWLHAQAFRDALESQPA
jgi:hypothetical protein